MRLKVDYSPPKYSSKKHSFKQEVKSCFKKQLFTHCVGTERAASPDFNSSDESKAALVEHTEDVCGGSYPHCFLYVVLSHHLCRAVHVPLQTADQLSETQHGSAGESDSVLTAAQRSLLLLEGNTLK